MRKDHQHEEVLRPRVQESGRPDGPAAREDYRSLTAACTAIGEELGVSRETLRNWVRQAEVDAGHAPGVTTEENEEMNRLHKENKRLREANEILKKATVFFAGELDPRNH